jgi:hypothetical protein
VAVWIAGLEAAERVAVWIAGLEAAERVAAWIAGLEDAERVAAWIAGLEDVSGVFVVGADAVLDTLEGGLQSLTIHQKLDILLKTFSTT